jgi:hypothetical protein
MGRKTCGLFYILKFQRLSGKEIICPFNDNNSRVYMGHAVQVKEAKIEHAS